MYETIADLKACMAPPNLAELDENRQEVPFKNALEPCKMMAPPHFAVLLWKYSLRLLSPVASEWMETSFV